MQIIDNRTSEERQYDFAMSLFIGRITRQSILLELSKAITTGKGLKDFNEACSLMNEIVDSERASVYLFKNPDRIVMP